MIRKNGLLFWLIITTILSLISLIYFPYNIPSEYTSYANRQIIRNGSINTFKKSNRKFNFMIERGYWNFTLNSFLRIKLEADITSDINYFIRNNVQYLKNVYNFQIPVVEQEKHFGSMSAVAVRIKIFTEKTLILILSRIWYSKTVCHVACNPDRSYIYAEAFTSDYRKTFYNLTSKNGKLMKFPSILNITVPELDECCLGPEDPRIVLDENNQLFVTFNMIDTDRRRKIWLYDIFSSYQTPFTVVSNNQSSLIEKNWTPFIKDNKLYFIYSYNPLKILKCSSNKNTCQFISNIKNNNEIGSLRGGTQFVRYRNTNYFVAIARTTVSCQKCQRFYRPHLVVLSINEGKFHLVYVSEPLILDNLPIFASYYLQKNKYSSDFCNNIIRIMTPGSIIDWKWPNDKLTFTISINDKRSFILSINGIGKVVKNLIRSIKTEYSRVFFNDTLDMKIVSYSEEMAINYCESISRK